MLCNTPTANRGGILTLAAGCTDGRYAQKVYFAKTYERPTADDVGGTCSTGIECAKVQLL
jgi:hypothetical protein